MRPWDLLTTAFLNLWRRKFRAFLTVLGMVIGVSSILVMVSLGIGIKEATIESFAGTGSLTVIRVNAWSYQESSNGMGMSKEVTLNKKSLEAFQKLSGVTYVMPMVEGWGMLKSGNYATDVSILGVTKPAMEAFGIQLAEGKAPGGKKSGSGGFGDMAMTAMFIGLVTAYIGSYIGEIISGEGLFTFTGNWLPLAVAAVSALAMALFTWISEKPRFAWVESFSIAASMLVGMASAVVLKLA